MSQKSITTTTSFTVSSNESLNKPPYSATSLSGSQSSGINVTSGDSPLDNHFSGASVHYPTNSSNNMFMNRQSNGRLPQSPNLPPPPPPPPQESFYGSVVSSPNIGNITTTTTPLENIHLSNSSSAQHHNGQQSSSVSPVIYGVNQHQNNNLQSNTSSISNVNSQQQSTPLLSTSQEPISLPTSLLQTTNSSPHSQKFYYQQQSPNYNQRSSTSSLDSSSSALLMPINVKSMLLHGVSSDEVLSNWLTSIKCEDYLKNFVEHGYDMHLVTRMTPQDLAAIGCKSPALRKKLLLEIKKLNLSDDIPEIRPVSLDKWLESLKLGEYYSRLVSEGYETIEKVCQLTWEDLEEIGINRLGHQKRILLGIEKLNKLTKREEENFNDNSIYDVHPNHRISLNGENRLSTLGRVRSGFFQTRSGANLDHRGLPVAKVMPAFKQVNSSLIAPQNLGQQSVQTNHLPATNGNVSNSDYNKYNGNNHRLSSINGDRNQSVYDDYRSNGCGQEEVYKMSDLATTLKRNPGPLPPVRTNSLKVQHDFDANTNVTRQQIETSQQPIYGTNAININNNSNNNNNIRSGLTNYMIAPTNSTSFLRTPKLGTLTATTNKMLTLGGHIQTITNGQSSINSNRAIVPVREAPLPPVQQQQHLQKHSPSIPDKIEEEPTLTTTGSVNGQQYVANQYNLSANGNSELNSSLIGHQLASADEFPPPPPCQ